MAIAAPNGTRRHFRPPMLGARQLFALPVVPGARLTAKRLFNLYLVRYEYLRGRTRLRSYPNRLVVEPASACNLRCPYCFTGAGGIGRQPGLMTLELYRKLLDELGDTLLELEAFHWGEPLLNPHLSTMIRAASDRGIATTVNSNLSLELGAEGAEHLVSSGLTELTVSIDGSQQEIYEQYRVRGRLDLVRENCALLAAAKRRLTVETPRLNVEFHVFPHNLADVEPMRAMVRDMGMNLRVFKGVVPGAELHPELEHEFCVSPIPTPCIFLWGTALVSTDGGCLPCRGAFYANDDMGKLAVAPEELGSASFREIWNGPRYQAARSLFRSRVDSPLNRRLPCLDCPNTVMWERWKAHRIGGGELKTFDVGYGTNEMWNYFWNRRPAGAPRLHRPDPSIVAGHNTSRVGAERPQ